MFLSIVVHQLGPQNVLAFRAELQTNFSHIKLALQSYRALLLAAKGHPDTATINRAIAKINGAESASVLREEAKRTQRQNQVNFRLTQAKRRLAYHLDPTRDPAAFYTMTLKALARDLKLDHFMDDHGTYTTMMICGKLIVLDIDISTNGEILKVKVNHPNAEHFSEKIDKMVLRDLK
ncbi:hypothetical protein L0F63_004017 [Massospora cicadina]|nr:hypothetical protein L0F63_004017 [Massospora cicadina]